MALIDMDGVLLQYEGHIYPSDYTCTIFPSPLRPNQRRAREWEKSERESARSEIESYSNKLDRAFARSARNGGRESATTKFQDDTATPDMT